MTYPAWLMKTALTVAFAFPALASAADPYPQKPITMVVPQAAGGGNDVIGRIVAADLSQRLGQQVVIENRAGAGGNVGTQHVAKAAPDGYTLLMTINSTQAINPALYKKAGFDPVKDFEPVGLVASVPNVLVAHPSFPPKTVSELIALAKAQPLSVRAGSAGNGTIPHLALSMLNSAAGIQIEHIPYKGIAPALTDVMGNQIPLTFASLPSALPHIRAGKLKALAITSARPSAVATDIPPLADTIPGYSADLWVGLFAVKGTPQPVIQKLEQALQQSLADKTVRDKLLAQGAEILATTPQQTAKILADDLVKWAKIVRESGATVD